MWNKVICLPVKKNDPTINDNGIMMEKHMNLSVVFRQISATVPGMMRFLRNRMVIPQDQVVEIMACNYSGESFLVDESTGEIYDIKRRYQKNKSMKVQLTCQMRERGKAQVGQWQG